LPKPQAKATKAQRAATALSKELLLYDLAAAYKIAEGDDKTRLAMELLPYFAPKLKAVDVTQTADVRVTVCIGGLDG